MRRQLFVDMDGVLVDFDKKVLQIMGRKPDPVEKDDEMWNALEKIDHFYLDLEWMEGAKELWSYVLPHNPWILSAVPSRKGAMQIQSGEDKVVWCSTELGAHVPVIITLSKIKHTCGKPGDILIDDREENIIAWRKMGGVGILHKNVQDTLNQLRELGL